MIYQVPPHHSFPYSLNTQQTAQLEYTTTKENTCNPNTSVFPEQTAILCMSLTINKNQNKQH